MGEGFLVPSRDRRNKRPLAVQLKSPAASQSRPAQSRVSPTSRVSLAAALEPSSSAGNRTAPVPVTVSSRPARPPEQPTTTIPRPSPREPTPGVSISSYGHGARAHLGGWPSIIALRRAPETAKE
ncbi:hypothetical protein BU26DRAFT_179110 [Trematosphaeria pertusa]|uniref:Uncharacterized protein n=1 Tax=Trematosphaeria pertusa TaxID=390896 RepID=A0A6A6HUP2_9PLEO|nr:uncharacterized protein BU26DRAFT_179110 [Trematosphaeria pertusa]KAF2241482.1 hypothetical protein BU26DRAFT_179110 [Trematosphaeria pertusa]